MKLFFKLFILCLIFSCTKKKELEIYGQWHLLPHDITTDWEKARELPQFKSQVELYRDLALKVQKGEINTIIAEGCTGEITKDFKERFNGWDMKALINLKDDPSFAEILAPVQMKLKAKFPKLKVICGDNLELIKKNQLSLSEVQGHLNFLNALIQNYQKDFKKYLLYKENYQKISALEKFPIHPILYAKEQTFKNLESFFEIINLRNDSFIKTIKEIKKEEAKIAVIIGKIHTKDLQKKLERDFKLYVFNAKDTLDEEEIVFRLKEALLKIKIPSFIHYSQMPDGFEIEKFPLNQNIAEKDLLNDQDKEELLHLEHYYQTPIDFITSDYDEDGIRDFTISSGNDFLVIAAEDSDWDNDKEWNLNDVFVGKHEVAKVSAPVITNQFQLLEESEEKLKKWFADRKIILLSDEKTSLDLLSLYLFKTAYELFKTTPDIRYIRAVKKKNNERNVFFAFVKHTRTVEFYTEDFFTYIKELKLKRFKEISFASYTKEVVSIIILQSLIHELSHAKEFFTEADFKEYGWTFKKEKLDSRYLVKFREPSKVLNFLYLDQRYQGRSFKEWQEKIKEGPAFKTLESYQSLLKKINTPSLYSLTSMDEWESEVIAACGLQRLFPKLKEEKEGKRWELLIDFNPQATPSGLCEKHAKAVF